MHTCLSGRSFPGVAKLMQEYINNLSADFSEALVQFQQVDWTTPICLVIGGVFCTRLCAGGGPARRLAGLVGLGIVAWVLWNYVVGLT